MKLITLLVSLPCLAPKFHGHIGPWPDELLPKPIYLSDKCSGVSVIEGSGTINSKLCNIAVDNFVPYLKDNNISVITNKQFKWDISILNDGSCYRCLNDTEYRFVDRPSKNVLGLTSELGITFLSNKEVNTTTLAHELFHAMVYFYGVKISVEKNEELASGFEAWVNPAFTRNK